LKRLALIFLLAISAAFGCDAQSFSLYEAIPLDDGDTLYVAPSLPPAYCYPPLRFRNRKAEKFYWRTVRDVKKCLPYAKVVGKTLNQADVDLARLKTEKERKAYLDKLEKEIKRKYEPVLWDMSYSQGKMLIKLINRETNFTSYELLRVYRGKVNAMFWQGVARIFRANLKDEYDGSDKDRITERVINLVEAGQL
jgi:hypothetical protein